MLYILQKNVRSNKITYFSVSNNLWLQREKSVDLTDVMVSHVTYAHSCKSLLARNPDTKT